jgi:hypothetical protein
MRQGEYLSSLSNISNRPLGLQPPASKSSVLPARRAAAVPSRHRPPKPPDRREPTPGVRPYNKAKWVQGHWRWVRDRQAWEWVRGHWSK